MTVSPKRRARRTSGALKSERFIKQSWLKRALRLETLERRELMAADLLPFHNYIYPHDVDGDFQISPLDALVVINELNASGSGSLADKPAPNGFNQNVDVDADNILSPLDVLGVINFLNNGEGELPPVVQVKYQFFRVNADGTVGAQIPDADTTTAEPDAIIGTNERVIVRTTMKDLRSPTSGTGTAQGVFSAYHDLNFSNEDGSGAEKLQLQWGEFNRLTLNPTITGGSFTLRYGTQETASITPVIRSGAISGSSTRPLVQTALEGVFGAGNIRVTPADPGNPSSPDYAISFIGALARREITPEGSIGANSLVASNGNASATFQPLVNPSPVADVVARAAMNHNIDNGVFEVDPGPPPQTVQIVRYTNGPAGSLLDQSPANSPTRTIRRLGGFANVTTPQDSEVAARFLGVVDTLFVGAQTGTIKLNGTITPLPTQGQGDNLGISLFGAQAQYLTANQVVLPTGTIRILDRLTAVTDVYNGFTEDDPVFPTTLNVMQNDIDRFGSSRSIIGVTQPTVGGSVTIVNGGSLVRFVPTADYNGPVVFTYSIRNNLNDEATGTVTVNLAPVNDPPRVIQTNFSVNEDQTLVLSAASAFSPGPANELTEVPPQTVTFTNVQSTAQTNGTVSLVSGQISYTPTSNFFGTATIIATAQDSLGASSTATLTITVNAVNDAPVLLQSAFTIIEDVAKTISASEIFAPGPANESSQTVSLSVIAPLAPSDQLVATIDGSGKLLLTPAANFFGGPVFVVVRGTDNGTNPNNLFTDATLTITVTGVNDNPIAEDDAFSVVALADANTLNVRANDLPGPRGESENIFVRSVSAVAPSAAGSVVVGPNGSAVVFTPSASPQFFGKTATFTYVLEDEFGLTDTALVTVTILPPASPFAVDDDYRTNASLRIPEDTSATFDVLANDYSTGTKSLTVGTTTPPQPQIISGQGAVSIEGNLIRYTPAPNFFGEVVFTYAMDDTDTVVEANERRVATVTMLVTPVNDAPIAVNRTFNGTEDTPLSISISDLNLSSGPFENDGLEFASATMLSPTAGSVQIVNGLLRYQPAADFFGQALVLYSVRDNGTPSLTSNDATITIDVAAVNDPPIANPDPVQTVAESTPTSPTNLRIVIASLLANDSAGPANEGQTVSFVPLTGVINTQKGGTVTQEGPDLVYRPATSYNGPDSFTYQITDGQPVNGFATGTVTLNVTEVNDPPVASTLVRGVYAGLPATFDLTSDLAQMPKGPANESGQTLRIVQIIQGSSRLGDAVLNANGTITFSAPLGTSGRETFEYVIRDNGTTNGVADPKEARGTFHVDISPFIPSEFKGYVYVDDNANGRLDPNELRIGGADVTLVIPANPAIQGSRAQEMKAVTRADGSYSFDLLPPGIYSVSYAVPILTTDAPEANLFTRTIVAPGGVSAEYNFGVLGITARYANLLENLSSNLYSRPGSEDLRVKGLYASIGADGKSEWTIARGSFQSDYFHEVVISDDGTKAFLTAVRGPDRGVYTAVLSRTQFVHVVDQETGARVVRVLVRSEDLSWQRVNLATPPLTYNAKKYLDAVDDFFMSEGWHSS
ncbi:MAG: tandem-95 repeat protein [Planctomycetes bacterium]|nr:tandem-95 repeat protein [Planctomycetota bacterium]